MTRYLTKGPRGDVSQPNGVCVQGLGRIPRD